MKKRKDNFPENLTVHKAKWTIDIDCPVIECPNCGKFFSVILFITPKKIGKQGGFLRLNWFIETPKYCPYCGGSLIIGKKEQKL